METLSKEPDKSIWGSSENRAEAKAIYHMLANEKFDREAIIRAHRSGTVKRMGGHAVVLAVQDTTVVNYNGQRQMKGNGYIGDNTAMGVNIHTCVAVTADGVMLGALDQRGYNRKREADTATRDQKKRHSIEEKESNRWLETMGKANTSVPEGIKLIHVCDREGDMYWTLPDQIDKKISEEYN